MKIQTSVEVNLTVEQLATLFADMSAEEQARFFVCVARLANEWESPAARVLQFSAIGDHLAGTASTYEARDMIEMIHASMKG